MNKGLFLGLAATALLASCSSDEVLESVEPQAISFENAFVDKSTRAVNDLTNELLTNFYVFAGYTNTGGVAKPVTVYENHHVTKSDNTYTPDEVKYWVANKDYRFIAYSDGNRKIDKNLNFVNTTGNITIEDYVVNPEEPKDLLVSTVVTKTNVSSKGQGAVSLTFSHLLSKVKFTFTSEFGASSVMTISDLQFSANSTGTYTSSNNSWNPKSEAVNKNYKYQEFEVTGGKSNASSAEENYVLPQSNAGLVASFTVVVKDANKVQIGSRTFENVPLATPSENTWAAGFIYNYQVSINASNITMDADPIQFTTSVSDWSEQQDVTPALPPLL